MEPFSEEVTTLEMNLDAMTDEERKNLKGLFDIPMETIRKIVDIYNEMAKANASKTTVRFSNGMKIKIELDDSEYKRPVIKV